MSTHATIGALNADGSVDMIYLHSDGYPSYAAVMLHDHWSDEDKVRKLISMGDCSMLGSEIGERHDFGDHYPKGHERRGWSRFYGRDRGDTTPPSMYSSVQDARRDAQRYFYLFVPKHGWHAVTGRKSAVPVSGLVAKIKAEGESRID